jgi:hypothetical protein
MLDPRPRLGDALVAPLLTLGQRLVAMALALDLVAETVFLQLAACRTFLAIGDNPSAGL